jgi:uncharacterized protein (UPF0333 family)
MRKRGRETNNKLGQASFDYLLLAGLIIIAIIPIFAWATKTFSDTTHFEKAQDTVDITVGLSNVANKYGLGYSRCVKVSIPEGGAKFSVVDGEIVFKLNMKGNEKEFSGLSKAEAFGELNVDKSGTKQICAHKVQNFDGVIIAEKGPTCEKDDKCLASCELAGTKDPDCGISIS